MIIIIMLMLFSQRPAGIYLQLKSGFITSRMKGEHILWGTVGCLNKRDQKEIIGRSGIWLGDLGFPGCLDSKESAYKATWVQSHGEGNGNPFQYSCLENSMDRGACWAKVHGVTKSWTRLSDFHFLSLCHLRFSRNRFHGILK